MLNELLEAQIIRKQPERIKKFIYSKIYEVLSAECNPGTVGEFPGSHPVTLNVKHLRNFLKEDYLVCEKTDGIRFMFFTWNQNGQRFLSSFLDRTNSSYGFEASPGSHYDMMLFDGELFTEKIGQKNCLQFSIYDTVIYKGLSVCQENLITRLGYAVEFLGKYLHQNPMIRFVVKQMTKSYHCGFVYNQVANLNHENDGLIFTPVNQPYVLGRCKSLYKWKPFTLNTVDFLLIGVPEMDYVYQMKCRVFDDNLSIFCYFFDKEGYELDHPVVEPNEPVNSTAAPLSADLYDLAPKKCKKSNHDSIPALNEASSIEKFDTAVKKHLNFFKKEIARNIHKISTNFNKKSSNQGSPKHLLESSTVCGRGVTSQKSPTNYHPGREICFSVNGCSNIDLDKKYTRNAHSASNSIIRRFNKHPVMVCEGSAIDAEDGSSENEPESALNNNENAYKLESVVDSLESSVELPKNAHTTSLRDAFIDKNADNPDQMWVCDGYSKNNLAPRCEKGQFTHNMRNVGESPFQVTTQERDLIPREKTTPVVKNEIISQKLDAYFPSEGFKKQTEVQKAKKDEFVTFKKSDREKNTSKKSGNRDRYHGQIGEFRFDHKKFMFSHITESLEKGEWVLYKMRIDKTHPNGYKVVLNILKSIEENISIDNLTILAPRIKGAWDERNKPNSHKI